MAEIDKLIAKEQRTPARAPAPGSSPPAPLPRGAAAPAQRAAAPVARGGRTVLTAWVRVMLGVAVAAGVGLAWPYAHACGLALYGYLAAAGGVVLAGIWGAVTSWKRRLPLAHLISLLVTVSGSVLVGKVLLDRSDYGRHRATWSCP